MKNLLVSWVLPSTRSDGTVLGQAEIAYVLLELSADGGVNFSEIDRVAPPALNTIIRELEAGTWTVRGTVVDTAGKMSEPRSASITIEAAPPGALVSITLDLQ